MGSKFHDAIDLFLNDNLDEDSLDEALVKPIRGFIAWWKEYTSCFTVNYQNRVEQPLYDEKLKYAGTPDMVGLETVYDWKLRPFNKILDPLQMAAYSGLTNCSLQRVVSFDKNGNYKEYNAYRKNAWGMFRKLLEHYWEEQKFQKLLKGWKGE